MAERLTLKNVRLSFPRLWKMESFKDSRPAFSAQFILNADDPQVDSVEEAMLKVAEEKWGAKHKMLLSTAKAKDKVPLHNGDTKADLEGYPGNWFVTARSYSPILILNRDKSPLTEEMGIIYGGCFVDASIEVYGYDVDGVKGLTASLRWVQFRRAGDAFAGGAPVSEDELAEIEDLSSDDDGGLM